MSLEAGISVVEIVIKGYLGVCAEREIEMQKMKKERENRKARYLKEAAVA